jgi:hypothetical protein
MMQQSTGEDWNGVSLTLATAEPATATASTTCLELPLEVVRLVHKEANAIAHTTVVGQSALAAAAPPTPDSSSNNGSSSNSECVCDALGSGDSAVSSSAPWGPVDLPPSATPALAAKAAAAAVPGSSSSSSSYNTAEHMQWLVRYNFSKCAKNDTRRSLMMIMILCEQSYR